MKANESFDYGKWLLQRSEKESTKTVNFSELTKKEKVDTLLALLGKTEQDFKDTQISGVEQRPFGECSSIAKNAILMQECTAAIAEKRAPNLPKDTDMVEVPVKTGFLAASLVAKINFLSGLHGKPIDTVTGLLPCGEAWVSGLIAYCKGLETSEADKEA
jgi:hypothetical protein